MSDIGSSISGRGKGPEDRLHDPLYLAQLQRLRDNEHQEETIQNPNSKIFHFATALLCLKKFIHECTQGLQQRSPSLSTQKALTDLMAFKNILEELGKVDKSHDPSFTHRLSQLWQKLYENCEGLALQTDPLTDQILLFVNQVAHFPPGEDHTLGYYLTEHAGQDWIPFPFMHLLADLHEEFQTSSTTSQLGTWIRALSEITGSYNTF